MDAEVSTEMAWGLANSNQPFLWVVRPGSVRGCDWIECLPRGFGEIECVVRRLLVSKEGEEMRRRAMEIEEQVKVAVSHGGSSQNSMDDLVNFILSL
ncbi:hypothetical protein L1887_45909 [Cichorium endivia]|nr:hypothetical protein L1887_45909 [Cichorium endivia]